MNILPKAGAHLLRPLLTRLFLARLFLPGLLLIRSVGLQAAFAVALAAGLGGLLYAQASKAITIIMLDGKTGKAIIPSNFVIRVDHRDAIHNEWLRLNDDGAGFVNVPAETTFSPSRAPTTGPPIFTSTAMRAWRKTPAPFTGTRFPTS